MSTLTAKDLLLNHLEYTFQKEAWQPALAMTVQGLTAAQASWKPGADRHSIWQIVRHVTHWKRATLEAWQGTRPLFRGREVTARFEEIMRTDWQDASGTDTDWQADVRALEEVSQAIRERAQALDLESLLQPFPGEEWVRRCSAWRHTISTTPDRFDITAHSKAPDRFTTGWCC